MMDSIGMLSPFATWSRIFFTTGFSPIHPASNLVLVVGRVRSCRQ